MADVHHGSCLCGSVRFEVTGPLREVIVCHCSQCRRTSGHVWAASSVPLDRFRLTEAEGLDWYRASDLAERGFCRNCGATLFWKPDREYRISFSPSALDGPSGLHIAHHWHREDAGDYYAPEGPPPAPGGSPPERLDCRCLCGGVAFSLPGPAGEITACHCPQCRKLSGHFAASFDADEASLEYSARETLHVFRTPGGGERGFCRTCGSSMWFRDRDGVFSIEAGCVSGRTGGRLARHIFVGDKGDYYNIEDGLPQARSWD
jgi:hypothetical protein